MLLMDSFVVPRLWRTCMSKLATKLIAICFILGWNVHASSQEKAEEFGCDRRSAVQHACERGW